jgi:flagellar protein FliL
MAPKKSKAEEETAEELTPKKGGKLKKLLLLLIGASALVGAGVGAAAYLGIGVAGHEKKEEDPNRPKLVERSKEAEEPGAESEGGDGKEPPFKIGTIAVKSDKAKIDPKKYEVTYFPIEQQFTSNLADGESFVQIGLSLSTYYDGRMIANIKRQMIPIRSAILTVLSTQNASVISSPDGRALLQGQLARAVNTVLREKEGFGGVDNVYVTSMVIQ